MLSWDLDEEPGMHGYASTLRGGKLHHTVGLYTVPFNEMDEVALMYAPVLNTTTIRRDENSDEIDKCLASLEINYKSVIAKKNKGNVKFTPKELLDLKVSTNKCEICGKVLEKLRDRKGDHDHCTGKLRGVLCAEHNLMLGTVEKLKRNSELSAAVDEYLLKYSE